MRTTKTDQTDAQADLSLLWALLSEGTFSHDQVLIIITDSFTSY